MDLKLAEKPIIVTGGKHGIGRAITESLAREGAIPVVLNRSEADEDFTASMSDLGATYEYYTVDLNNTEQIAPIVDEVYRKYGVLAGVVNNAGTNDNLDLDSTTWEEFEKSLHGNLTHYYETVHASVNYLRESKGSILNITSKTAVTGQGKTSAYAAAKGAILGLTREWAAALAKDSVRANAIVVAEAWTPMYANWIRTFGAEAEQQARLEEITENIPLEKRMTTPKEIADMGVFLLSPLSSHTTGQQIYVDGGYVHLDRALN
ncbi:SDR family oxidoreductase [Auritidibacter sp. NML100628]|uniref:SDR family oxidoreductase n=1 Tax=Auritidibacter sp. NML100628 TaxID=2170742 RepID=UPI000D7368BF|nr:SDR family oxidoreductase [Auritidibacter sp. NML100628]PXA75655.1 short chain dehydrogenase [Auritidibacter sp. NML100628]